MKKISTIFITLSCLLFSTAQIVNIPDANFKAALIALGHDKNKDGNIQRAEVGDVIDLNVSNMSIADLTGIEAFTTLFFLNCSQNQLTKVNLSKNTYLTNLNLSYNKLDSIDLSKLPMLSSLQCDHNSLKELQLAYNFSISTLLCGHNQLTNLDVSFLNLYRFECSYNKITTLDLGLSANLSTINCGSNLLSDTLDISNCPDLTYIACDYNQLKGLKLKDSLKVTTLLCNNNLLTYLDIKDKIELNNLSVSSNMISELDLTSLTKLTQVNCTNNKLTGIDVSHASNLSTLYCGINNITKLDINQNAKLTILGCNNTKITFLDITKNILLKTLNTQDNPSLLYICVNNIAEASTNSGFTKDIATQYTENCKVVTDLEVGTNNLGAEILPNPSIESFNLNISEPSDITIVNIHGGIENTFKNIQSINFGQSYKSGLYLVQIQNSHAKKVIKIMKK